MVSKRKNVLPMVCLTVVFLLATAIWPTGSASADPPGYSLAWSDEFNSLSLGAPGSGANWTPYFPAWNIRCLSGNSDDFAKFASYEYTEGPGNGDTCQKTDSQGTTTVGSVLGHDLHEVSNGTLKLYAYPAPAGTENHFKGKPYVAGMISGQAYTQNYGLWEFRFRATSLTRGAHVAVWLLTTDNNWNNGEIDILEQVGCPDQQLDSNGQSHDGNCNYIHYARINLPVAGTSQDAWDLNMDPADWAAWHTYQLEITPSAIVWRRDGVEKLRYDGNYNQTWYPLVTIEGASKWPGDPDGRTVWPQTVEVDYVRIYKPSTNPTSTPTSPPTTSNLLQNTGFESDWSNWGDSSGDGGGGTAFITTSDKHDGTKSAELMNWIWRSQSVSLLPNTSYTISGWGKRVSGSGACKFNILADTFTQGVNFTSSSWTQQTLTFTTPSSSGWSFAQLYAENSDCRFDDVRLVQT